MLHSSFLSSPFASSIHTPLYRFNLPGFISLLILRHKSVCLPWFLLIPISFSITFKLTYGSKHRSSMFVWSICTCTYCLSVFLFETFPVSLSPTIVRLNINYFASFVYRFSLSISPLPFVLILCLSFSIRSFLCLYILSLFLQPLFVYASVTLSPLFIDFLSLFLPRHLYLFYVCFFLFKAFSVCISCLSFSNLCSFKHQSLCLLCL